MAAPASSSLCPRITGAIADIRPKAKRAKRTTYIVTMHSSLSVLQFFLAFTVGGRTWDTGNRGWRLVTLRMGYNDTLIYKTRRQCDEAGGSFAVMCEWSVMSNSSTLF